MMDPVLLLLFLSSLLQPGVADDPKVTSYRATVDIVSVHSRIFSGENVLLRCNIPNEYNFSWRYLWFKGSGQIFASSKDFKLWNVGIKDGGNYSCQGVRDSLLGEIKTQPSLPVQIHVDGGWVILQGPPHPVFVGDTLNLKCLLRGNPPVHQTILYRDGTEIMRQSGSSLHFHLADVTTEDEGMYSCRASWDVRRRTHSVMSVPTPVKILEFLSQPVLEIVENQFGGNKLKLICHVTYNAPAPAPPVHYYFYRDGDLLGTATSLNRELVRHAPGWYSCRAKVPKLGLWKWSEPRRFGNVAEPVRSHPSLKSPSDHSGPPAEHPTVAQRSTFYQHTESSNNLTTTSEMGLF